MEIRKDTFFVEHHDRDLRGDQVEPEQQPVTRVLEVDGPTSLGNVSLGKELPTTVSIRDNAATFANGLRTQCLLCKHFKRELGQALIQKYKGGTMEERQMLNRIRTALMETQNTTVQEQMLNPMDGDTDVEAGLGFLGLCEIFTEISGDVLFVHQQGGCPPDQDFFVAKDAAAEKYGSEKFDAIMRRAQGKT